MFEHNILRPSVYTVGIHSALAYFRYCIPAAKRTPRTLLMRHTANFVCRLRRKLAKQINRTYSSMRAHCALKFWNQPCFAKVTADFRPARWTRIDFNTDAASPCWSKNWQHHVYNYNTCKAWPIFAHARWHSTEDVQYVRGFCTLVLFILSCFHAIISRFCNNNANTQMAAIAPGPYTIHHAPTTLGRANNAQDIQTLKML